MLVEYPAAVKRCEQVPAAVPGREVMQVIGRHGHRQTDSVITEAHCSDCTRVTSLSRDRRCQCVSRTASDVERAPYCPLLPHSDKHQHGGNQATSSQGAYILSVCISFIGTAQIKWYPVHTITRKYVDKFDIAS